MCDEELHAVYSESGMTCKLECLYEEYNLSHSKYLCMSKSCSYKVIVLNNSAHACLANETWVKNFSLTNSSIWYETTDKRFEKLSECSYGGCIRQQICKDSCSPPCENVLHPIYSNTGITCIDNDSCTFKEYNLSEKSYQCKNESCDKLKLIVN